MGTETRIGAFEHISAPLARVIPTLLPPEGSVPCDPPCASANPEAPRTDERPTIGPITLVRRQAPSGAMSEASRPPAREANNTKEQKQ